MHRDKEMVALWSKVQFGHTPVESTKSEFLAIRRPKRIKNPGEKFTHHWCKVPKQKYCLQVNIFEFDPSGHTFVESTKTNFQP